MLGGARKKQLKALAHHLKPLVQVGRNGVTPALLGEISSCLDAHELVKIRFMEFKDEKRDLAARIAGDTGAELVGMIGNVATIYRQNTDPAKRKIPG